MFKTDFKKTNAGPELWEKAKTLIPGGNQLLSKRAERFLPGGWPSYYSKAKGVEIWDLEGRRWIDMSIMAIGSCVLGYANDGVNAAVKKAVDDGSMSTLNCPEEVQLAEKLLELHPWAGMARFARTGGEACAIAVRIARAFSGRDKIAFCGYHGWHDWYLASNLSDSGNLDRLLVPGLKPLGIPRGLANTAFPFHYGSIQELKNLIKKHRGEIGVIIMEVERHQFDLEFLKQAREVAAQTGAVLIYDEITSGFRLRAGGVHMLHGLEPDLVILGKAMGNGYPISAILGKKEVMRAAQNTFISSTYWTEKIGFTAALEVIRQFEENHVAGDLIRTGRRLIQGLCEIIRSAELKIEVTDIMPPAPVLIVHEENPDQIQTLFTQEMLKRGFLASDVIYISTAHTEEIIDQYLRSVREVFEIIRSGIKARNVGSLLEGPVRYQGLGRLDLKAN